MEDIKDNTVVHFNKEVISKEDMCIRTKEGELLAVSGFKLNRKGISNITITMLNMEILVEDKWEVKHHNKTKIFMHRVKDPE